jgi:hypothetical protein
MHLYEYIHTYIFTHTYTQYIHTHIHAFIHTHTYITHTHTHTHAHTYINRLNCHGNTSKNNTTQHNLHLQKHLTAIRLLHVSNHLHHYQGASSYYKRSVYRHNTTHINISLTHTLPHTSTNHWRTQYHTHQQITDAHSIMKH